MVSGWFVVCDYGNTYSSSVAGRVRMKRTQMSSKSSGEGN